LCTMSRLILILTFILININLLSGRPVKILFLGNGILSYNGIPWEFRVLALSARDEVLVDAYMQDSYALSFHNGLLGDQNAIEKIRSQSWDFVVLQEQSILPVIPKLTELFTIPAIRDLNKIIKDTNRCARIVLFMTWAWPIGDQYCLNIDSIGRLCSIPFMDYFHMQDSLEASYLRIADTVGAEIAPVGVAWKNSFKVSPGTSLFSGFDNLSNKAGAYLSACVLYSTLFQKSPVGIEYISSLTREDALFLQQIAENSVLTNREKWRIKLWENLPVPSFDYRIIHNQVQYIDQSVNGDSWFWELGDGSISREKEPFHTYQEFGTYEVCLRFAYTDECPQVFCRDLTVEEMVIFYPNPFQDEILFKFQQDITGEVLVEWFTLEGHQILKEVIMDPSYEIYLFDTRNIPSGTYLINISVSGFTLASKLVKI